MSDFAPSFPYAQQAQIIRSNQRDLFHVSSLREQTEGVLRSWLGTRWLSRWDKEIDFLVKTTYYAMTTGRATQTLGEEYTDIWLHSAGANAIPSLRARAALILIPTLPRYLASRWGSTLPQESKLASLLKKLPVALEILTEANLAVFYLRGTYYTLAKRILGIRYIASGPDDPNSRPPSYSLLGILLSIRLVYQLITYLRSLKTHGDSELARGKRPSDEIHETFIDDQPVSTFLGPINPEGDVAVPAEEDERTILDFSRIPDALRAGRSCTLCLEERTASCATECGHLFCWNCIVGWGREKAECPLCRQSLSLTKLLPVYNL
ncbi:peroxisome assembly protein per8 [Abortiporus biennis]|nr:peroxisome assembly protein per8 [Abortiporus biennis]